MYRALIFRPLAALVPESIRSWISYRTPAHSFTPLEVERTRLSIVAQMGPVTSPPLLSRSEFNRRMRIAILRAVHLGLHRGPKLSILDVGCGAGFFVAVAKHFGHHCVGCDLPFEKLAPATALTYDTCLRALRCIDDRRELMIAPYQPLALDRTFDLITAGLICFNEYPSGATWSRPEWEFFVKDIRQYLAPRGRLFLEMNEHRHYGRLRWYDPPTLELFNRVGSVSQNKVSYSRG